MSRFKGKLYGYQSEGVKFALSNPYHLNGFEMGLGKTITSLAVACKLKAKTLVVAPAYLRKNWIEEIEKFTEGLDIEVISYDGLKKFAEFETIIKKNRKTGKETKTKKFLRMREDIPRYRFIISDEAHYLKNHKATRSIVFHHLMMKIEPSHMMLMSGTPIANRISEFWSLLQLCFYGKKYPAFQPFHMLYYKFCHRFSYERTFEVNNVPIVRFDGVKNVEELKALIKPVYIRKRAKDELDLPEDLHIDVMTKGSKKYDADLEAAYELFKVNKKDPQYMSLKAANALSKVGDTYKFVKDMLEQDKKVIVFTCHREAAKELGKKFKVVAITGEMDADERFDRIKKFNESDSGVLVATIGSASTGFNITSANYMVFNDFPFVPAHLDQAIKRMLRIGQKFKCFYYYMFSSEFDKKLFDMINRKKKDIGKVYE